MNVQRGIKILLLLLVQQPGAAGNRGAGEQREIRTRSMLHDMPPNPPSPASPAACSIEEQGSRGATGNKDLHHLWDCMELLEPPSRLKTYFLRNCLAWRASICAGVNPAGLLAAAEGPSLLSSSVAKEDVSALPGRPCCFRTDARDSALVCFLATLSTNWATVLSEKPRRSCRREDTHLRSSLSSPAMPAAAG
eukprot:1161646-Pelagomonas_calceolata.AAC.16